MSVERQLLMAASGVSTQYTIAKSLRLRASASAYLSRTLTLSATWTLSIWLKRGRLGASSPIFGSSVGFNANDTLTAGTLTTTSVYRDPSAWYHIVVSNSGCYVNGVSVGATSTGILVNPSIGNYLTNYFDGYIAELNLIDGQSLPASSFGETSSTTGVWIPKQYSGSYGTNGFYLKFTDTTSTTALGNDSSGNGNNWTPNNLSLTTGSTYDSMLDSPTNYDNGGTGVGNYAVLNPLDNGGLTIASANLNSSDSGGSWKSIRSTIGISSGKWYWEVTATSGTNLDCGISKSTAAQSTNNYVGADANGWGYVGSNGQKYTAGSGSAYGATYTSGDVVGIAFDADAGTLTFYKNNVSQGTAFTGLTSGPYFPAVSNYSSGLAINFGQRPFAYTPPTGYKALNTQNLSAPSIVNGASYMAATTYTGNGSTQTISGAAFQPDFVWGKSRSNAYQNILVDVIRGASTYLQSSTTAAEATNSSVISAFTSTGFTVGSDATLNGSGTTNVAWQWKAGGTAVTNTAGSITSSVSANTTSGFSVVTYTGTGANATVGHGLGIAPSFMIARPRNAVNDWQVYASPIGAGNCLFLNLTDASTAAASVWNSTAPTSSVFSLGTNIRVNGSGTNYVAYCFAAIPGYSAFGSYTGNGSSDGPFVFCGFRPRWIMVKQTNDVADWMMYDTSRDAVIANGGDYKLYANTSSAENASPETTTTNLIDYLSNGFKLRSSNTYTNASGSTYIYAAFAENPFQNARAR